MSLRRKILLIAVSVLAVVGILAVYLYGNNFAVLNPKGVIAEQQRNLMIFGTLLSLIIVVPVFVMTGLFAWRYRESNPKEVRYQPELDHNNKLEFIWWTVPLILIGILSVVTWRSSHALDPFKPIASDKKTLTVQVVALDWKWLFIYPEQNIASVNFMQFPVDRPVKFEITADAPMNSLWIPNLAGQMYAMTGMSSELNVMADKPGEYEGVSSNISGEGFAGMRFTARASSEKEFADWVQSVKRNPRSLDWNTYQALAQPSSNVEPIYYASADAGLYHKIMMKYLAPTSETQTEARPRHGGHEVHGETR